MNNDLRLRIGHNEIFTNKGMINSTDVFNFGSHDKNENHSKINKYREVST